MADTLTKEQRSRCMSNIRGKDTKPEMIVRKYLFSKGLRYRLHVKSLHGNPDIVLPKKLLYSSMVVSVLNGTISGKFLENIENFYEFCDEVMHMCRFSA